MKIEKAMSLRNLFFLILGIVLVAALSGCRQFQRVAYYVTMRPDSSGWRADIPLVFTADSATAPGLEPGQYHLYMVIRYRDSYADSKLYLRLEHTSLARGVRTRQICVNMEHPKDNPGAKVKLNKGLVELTLPIGYDYVDSAWTLSVEQRMAGSPIKGINDIGIKMVKE